MSNRPSLDDYVDVGERITIFKSQYPEGSLQTLDWQVVEVGSRTFVVYRAAAYRSPDDERPGHGIAWEPFPGPTPYTRDSELMNAETAAWGRACVAVGIMANRKIASRQEVKARRGEEAGSAVAAVTPMDRPGLREAARGLLWPAVKECYEAAGLEVPAYKRDAFTGLSDEQARLLRAALLNRKIADTTDVPFEATEVQSKAAMSEDELVKALTEELDAEEITGAAA